MFSTKSQIKWHQCCNEPRRHLQLSNPYSINQTHPLSDRPRGKSESPGPELKEEVPEVIEETETVTEEEDPRILKLREAFEAGKISEELFEKNLEKFRKG